MLPPPSAQSRVVNHERDSIWAEQMQPGCGREGSKNYLNTSIRRQLGLAEISSGHWLSNTPNKKNDVSTASSADRPFIDGRISMRYPETIICSSSVPPRIRRHYSLLIKRTAKNSQPPPLFGSASFARPRLPSSGSTGPEALSCLLLLDIY